MTLFLICTFLLYLREAPFAILDFFSIDVFYVVCFIELRLYKKRDKKERVQGLYEMKSGSSCINKKNVKHLTNELTKHGALEKNNNKMKGKIIDLACKRREKRNPAISFFFLALWSFIVRLFRHTPLFTFK